MENLVTYTCSLNRVKLPQRPFQGKAMEHYDLGDLYDLRAWFKDIEKIQTILETAYLGQDDPALIFLTKEQLEVLLMEVHHAPKLVDEIERQSDGVVNFMERVLRVCGFIKD